MKRNMYNSSHMGNQKIYVIFFSIVITALIALTIGGVLYQQAKDKNTTLGSSFKPGNPAQQGKTPDPVINSWREYTNPSYNLILNFPADWKYEDYAPAYPNGGTVIAFSPDPLPCNTCSYFQNGYFSVKIYNDKSDPEYFVEFQKRIANLNKDPNYQIVDIKGKKALSYANTVTFEDKGWVYEFSLDKDQGSRKAADSQIFQKVLESVEFTDLLFGS